MVSFSLLMPEKIFGWPFTCSDTLFLIDKTLSVSLLLSLSLSLSLSDQQQENMQIINSH